MAQKQMQRSTSAASASPSVGNGHITLESAERVRELIAGRHSKAALQVAKDLHKREATAESETLLVDAYRARIEDLIALRMTVEAKALFEIVRQRFPAAVPRFSEIEREFCVLDGRLDGIVAPLRDPNLATADREGIETFIRQRIDDLPALAAVSSLPPEHPLRAAASALSAALQSVTEGPVDAEALAFPQVSRRSPLASWKALVHAIACYYRHEDAECRKWLGAIAGDSVPARLIPSMTAMFGAKTGACFNPAEARLIAAAGDRGAALRASLAALESTFAAKKNQAILDAIRAVAADSIGLDATLRERLRQHIAVRCVMQHVPRAATYAALGGAPRLDAHYYRLLARALDEAHIAESSAEAVIVWDEFRRAAIREDWFADGGLEDGVLSLHMAEAVARLPGDVIEEMAEGEMSFYASGQGSRSTKLPSAQQLYERACQADPSTEAFTAWLRWAKKQQSPKIADDVAEQWRKARSTDVQPLLHLMDSAEQRNALKKSLKYLGEAEALDRLNPAVHRAKARLLVSAALRHLRKRKTHLVAAEIQQLLTVPEVRPGDLSALAVALRWCCAAVEEDKTAQQEPEAELLGAVGPVTTDLLFAALIRAAQLGSRTLAPPIDAKHIPLPNLLLGAIRACLLGDWVGLSTPLLSGWTDRLIDAVRQPNGSADAAQLLVLGEAALSDSARELAYAVSAAGLALGTANARFLFLRARALPTWMDIRREGCLCTALELARRERDSELAGKILDRFNKWLGPGEEFDSHPPELLSAIIEEELKFTKFPRSSGDDRPRYAAQLASAGAGKCDCPRCRAKRGEPAENFDKDDWDDDEDDDLDDVFGPAFEKALPSALLAIVETLPFAAQQRILNAIEAGENPVKVLETIDREVRKVAPGLGSRGSKWRPPKRTTDNGEGSNKNANQQNARPDRLPVQHTLF